MHPLELNTWNSSGADGYQFRKVWEDAQNLERKRKNKGRKNRRKNKKNKNKNKYKRAAKLMQILEPSKAAGVLTSFGMPDTAKPKVRKNSPKTTPETSFHIFRK